MNPDVLIVGAGPVGLFTAIEMKLLNPSLNIKILERNEQYSRHHILRLDESSLDQSEAYKKYEAVRNLKGYVPTSEIEQTFLKLATDLGVEIERGVKVDDCNELLKQHPTAHTIIGADGARSKVRAQLFDDEKIIDTNLQYIVEIKYKVKGSTDKLSKITYGPALGQVSHFVSENVGKEKNGTTPVSLFVFVSEQTYKEIRETPNAKLSDLKPNTAKMKRLLNTIQPWLSLRKVALNEQMIKDSESINGVALNVYQSKLFAKQIGEKRAYLVGDAGAAVPFYRALNAGLIAARVTANEIATQSLPNLEQLNATLSDLTQQEIHRANKQNKKVNFGRGVNSFLANVSKITTGALLTKVQEEAMLNARVTRVNIFRRNPRVLIGLLTFVVLSAALIPVFLPIYASVLTAAALSIACSALAVCLAAFIVKTVVIVKAIIHEKNNPIEPLEAFPWEVEAMEPHNSFSSLNLNTKTGDGVIYDNPKHYPNPLAPRSEASNDLHLSVDESHRQVAGN